MTTLLLVNGGHEHVLELTFSTSLISLAFSRINLTEFWLLGVLRYWRIVKYFGAQCNVILQARWPEMKWGCFCKKVDLFPTKWINWIFRACIIRCWTNFLFYVLFIWGCVRTRRNPLPPACSCSYWLILKPRCLASRCVRLGLESELRSGAERSACRSRSHTVLDCTSESVAVQACRPLTGTRALELNIETCSTAYGCSLGRRTASYATFNWFCTSYALCSVGFRFVDVQVGVFTLCTGEGKSMATT